MNAPFLSHISTRGVAVTVTLAVSAVLLFARLGHYPLWDDESHTCLTAQGVWETGDTSVEHGKNLTLYRNGLLARHRRERSSPPLQFYIAAPFVALGGTSSLAPRIPFALFGFASIALMLRWAWRDNVDKCTLLLLCIALIGNVSLMLYLRQARYYSVMIFLAVAVAYLYWNLVSRRAILVHAGLSVLLLASNYLAYAAVMAAMAVDYLIWGRKRRPIRGVEWLILLLPQALIGGAILMIWNPLRISAGDPSSDRGWLIDRFTLLWWTIRDADRCEFACAWLMILAIPVSIWKKSQPLARALVAMAIGILVIDLASPQTPRAIDTADVRYFACLIPLGIWIGVMTLRLLVGNFCWVALIVAPIAFWSNLLNISVFTFQSPRCTILKFANELVHPVPTPYRAAIDWINGHVQPGQSIAVLPNYYMYPLMFHCPQAIYAWQLQPEQRSAPEFKDLPPIHFMGQDTPNYIIAFGPVVGELIRGYHPPLGINYALSDILDVYWKDAYRPELMWRTFVPIPVNKDQGTAIYIFKKSLVPVQPAPPSPTQPPPSPPSDFHL